MDFGLEEIDHTFEEKEFVFLEFFLFLELMIDRCELLHANLKVGLVEAFGVLAQVIELGQVEVSVSWLLYLLDIEQQFLHPVLAVGFARREGLIPIGNSKEKISIGNSKEKIR